MLRVSFFWVIFLWASIQLAAQGPINGFLPKPGQTDIAFTYSQDRYDSFIDNEGNTITRELNATSYSLFIEHGLNERSSVVFSLPYIEHNALNKGLQDGNIWLKYRNERTQGQHGYHNILTSVGLSVPFSDYGREDIFAIGNRSTSFQARLGYQFEANFGWFAHVQTGLDFQIAPESSSAVPILIRAGWGHQFFYIDAWFERYQSLNNALRDNQAAGVGSNWSKIGGTAYFPVQKWLGIFASGAIVTGGKNIGESKRWNTGIVLRFGT